MAEHLAFSEVRIQDDLDQELAFKIVLEEIEDAPSLLPPGTKSVTLNVFPFHDVELLKRMLLRKLRAASWLKITDLQIYYMGVELANRRLLITFANQDSVTFRWKIREKLGQQMVMRGMRGVGGTKLGSKYHAWLDLIITAFQKNVNPKLTDEGTGSTYILYNPNHKPIGVFKPQNEEAFCPYNPRGYVGRMGQKGFRSGVVSGEGSAREVAAYYLDAYYGSLSNVPPTIMVEAIHPRFCYDPEHPRSYRDEFVLNGLLKRKAAAGGSTNGPGGPELSWKTGSLQMFVDTRECCGDYDPSVFSVSDVHKIGILDIRVCNMDRNEGNILVVREDQKFMDARLTELLDETEFIVSHPRYREQNLLMIDSGAPSGDGGGGAQRSRRSKYRLIPIDHGLTLPDAFDLTDFDLIWIRWPQSKIGFSQDELEYIEKLKPDKDAEWLRQKLDLRPECLRTMQVSTRLLKKGAKLGLNLYQISMLMVRLSPEQPSVLESWVKLAITQTWYSCYQSNLVRQRSIGMNCIMDLATPRAISTLTSNSGGGRKNVHVQFDNEKIHRFTSYEDSAGSASTAGRAGRGSRTVGRSKLQNANDELLLLQKTAHKLKNYTNWRTTATTSKNDHDIWTIEDVGGRVLTPDWDDPQILRRFFDAFDNILSLRLPSEAERHF